MIPPWQRHTPASSRRSARWAPSAANHVSSLSEPAWIRALSWSAESRLSPRPPEPSTSTHHRAGAGPYPSVSSRFAAMAAARAVRARISLETMRAAASPASPSAVRPAATSGEPAVRGRERGGVFGARDRIAQLGRGPRAVVEQIALGDHSERRPGGIRDAEMPHPQPIHASQRTIEHLVAGHRPHRRAHHRRHRHRIRIDGGVRHRAQQVALGGDTGGARLAVGDEERADPFLRHDPGRRAQRGPGADRTRGRAHHLVEPAQIEKAVDAGERGQRPGVGGHVSRHRVPPRLRFAVDEVRAAGPRTPAPRRGCAPPPPSAEG